MMKSFDLLFHWICLETGSFDLSSFRTEAFRTKLICEATVLVFLDTEEHISYKSHFNLNIMVEWEIKILPVKLKDFVL